MYRNWSARITAGPSLGRYISGTPWVGWLGAEIIAATASGAFGAGIFVNDQLNNAKRYRALLEASTFTADALTVRERGDGQFTANGVATFGIFEDGVRIGSTTLTGTIGTPAGPLVGVGGVQSLSSTAGAVLQTYLLGGLGAVSLAGSSVGSVLTVHQLLGTSSIQAASSPGRSIGEYGPAPGIPGRTAFAGRRQYLTGASGLKVTKFSPKKPAEIIHLDFDFSALTLEATAPVVVFLYRSGTADPTPSAMLLGLPNSAGDGLVRQLVQGGVDGADYLVTCQIDAPGGVRYVLTGLLPVRVLS